jgi:hypothetical protein
MECRRCGYTAVQKGDLIRHLKRKNPCIVNNEDITTDTLILEITKREFQGKTYKCDKCNKEFGSRQGKYQHKKVCKSIIEPLNSAPLYDILEEIVKREVNKLVSNTTNNGIINNHTININYQSENNKRNFGQENLDAIPLDLIRSTFMNLEFRTLFENLHCDPDYPENHNVRIKSIKRDLMEIYDDDKWKTFPSISAMKKVIDQLYRIFINFKVNHKDKVFEDMNIHELKENEHKLAEVLDWIHNNDSKLRQNPYVVEIEAALDENRKLLC